MREGATKSTPLSERIREKVRAPIRFARVSAALFLGVTLPLAPLAVPRAATAAEVERFEGVELSLLAGPRDGAVQKAGVSIALAPHWKTYWRYPGDAGIPPVIDWQGSENVKAVAVRFPAPIRFGTDGLESIGYTAPVILPLEVTLADPSKPARLDVTVLAGICKDICLPAQTKLSLPLAPTAPADPALDAAFARVPEPLPAGTTAPLSVAAIERDAKTTPESVIATVRVPAGAQGLDLFVEGPEGWALPLPAREADRGGLASFRFALDGLPTGAKAAGADLRFTVVTAGRGVEQTLRLP